MVRFAPLTPELRERLAQSRSRSFLRDLRRAPDTVDQALDIALEAAPNAKAVERAARRLARHRCVARAALRSDGNQRTLTLFDRCVSELDLSRFAANADDLGDTSCEACFW